MAVDTSVLVAGVLTWHEHHAPALSSLEEAIDQRTLLVPVPCLVESYAVMTRLPAPHRLSPPDAHALLHDNFASLPAADGLTSRECWEMLHHLSEGGIAGGRSYDAQILEVAIRGNAVVLLTLNPADFAALAPEWLEVRSPA